MDGAIDYGVKATVEANHHLLDVTCLTIERLIVIEIDHWRPRVAPSFFRVFSLVFLQDFLSRRGCRVSVAFDVPISRDIFGKIGFARRSRASRPEKSSGWMSGESAKSKTTPVYFAR